LRRVLYCNFLAFELNQRACFTNMFSRPFASFLRLFGSTYSRTMTMSISTDCVAFSLPSSGKTRRQKVLTSRWIVQSQFVFPGIPRGIDVNPLHSFAIERTTTRRRPAIELLTRYTSLQFFPRRATLSQYPSRCKRKATYPWISSHSVHVCISHLD